MEFKEDFVPLGDQPLDYILAKLDEIDDKEASSLLRAQSSSEYANLERKWSPPRAWLNTQHQFGYIAPFNPGSQRFHPISSATNITANEKLKNGRINIKLDHLHVFEYPKPLVDMHGNQHTILFSFEARNQIPGGGEVVAFNQTYQARSGQDTAISGYPVFIGLNVGNNGVTFACKTVNVGNSADEMLVQALTSDATNMGLSLLKTAQPALAPFVGVTRGLCIALIRRRANIPVQHFFLGLDFETGSTGARLALGSYVAVQVPRPDEINWDDWSLDSQTGVIVRTALAFGELSYTLPYNSIVFRVSQYEESN